MAVSGVAMRGESMAACAQALLGDDEPGESQLLGPQDGETKSGKHQKQIDLSKVQENLPLVNVNYVYIYI